METIGFGQDAVPVKMDPVGGTMQVDAAGRVTIVTGLTSIAANDTYTEVVNPYRRCKLAISVMGNGGANISTPKYLAVYLDGAGAYTRNLLYETNADAIAWTRDGAGNGGIMIPTTHFILKTIAGTSYMIPYEPIFVDPLFYVALSFVDGTLIDNPTSRIFVIEA